MEWLFFATGSHHWFESKSLNLYWHMYLGVGVLTSWVAIDVRVACMEMVPVDLGI